MKKYYYIDINGLQKGPIDGELLLSYGVTSTTPVWCEGMSDWIPAGTVAELQSLFQTPPAAPSTASNTPTRPPMPDDYMILSIISTALCCLLFGIISLYYSLKVSIFYNNKEYDKAIEASKKAKMFAIIGLIVPAVFLILYVIFLYIVGFGTLKTLATPY